MPKPLRSVLFAMLLVLPRTVAAQTCSQPLSAGIHPVATDCLYVLRAAVGLTFCDPECVCAPKGSLPTSATDALLCLGAATGQSVNMTCPCEGATSTTTSTTSTTTSTIATSTSTTTSTSTSTTLVSSCPEGGEPGYLNGITAAHNDVRANAVPTPDPALEPLCWSSSVAAVAQAWADNCTWQHNAGRGFLGENIFASSGNQLASAAAPAVQLWAAEDADYNYVNNSCSGVCGHYTQIVWRNTESVGCGIKVCNTGSPFGGGTWTYVVCDYSPPGNYVGQRPY